MRIPDKIQQEQKNSVNNFITNIKNIVRGSKLSDIEDDANSSVIINPFLKGETPNNKNIDDLNDEYNSEQYLQQNAIIPGNIHAFIYKADKESEYEYQGNVIKFSDSLPVVLIIENNGQTIKGINMNLCTRELRILILNAIQNMDEDFFDHTARELTESGKFPLSTKILGFFQKPDASKIFMDYLKSFSPKIDYSVIFREYSVSKIRNIRYIEPWQWSKIPFINYKQSIKQDTLDFIHKATGISTLKLSL